MSGRIAAEHERLANRRVPPAPNRLRVWVAVLLGSLVTSGGLALARSPGAALNVVEATELTGLYRWLLEAYAEHPNLYALGTTLFLVAFGLLIGLLAEALLSLLGIQTGRTDRVE